MTVTGKPLHKQVTQYRVLYDHAHHTALAACLATRLRHSKKFELEWKLPIQHQPVRGDRSAWVFWRRPHEGLAAAHRLCWTGVLMVLRVGMQPADAAVRAKAVALLCIVRILSMGALSGCLMRNEQTQDMTTKSYAWTQRTDCPASECSP